MYIHYSVGVWAVCSTEMVGNCSTDGVLQWRESYQDYCKVTSIIIKQYISYQSGYNTKTSIIRQKKIQMHIPNYNW